MTPTLSVAALHESETCVSPAVAARPVGVDGTIVSAGVEETVLAADALPAASIATTVYAYCVPLTSSVSVNVRASWKAIAIPSRRSS